jgi:hypothetical protein
MRSKLLLAALVLSSVAFSQSRTQNQSKHLIFKQPLARFSYQRVGRFASPNDHSSRSICFEVEPSGAYRIARETTLGKEIYQGDLTSDELSQVKEMLLKLDFADQTARGGRLVLRGSESFVAETTRDEQTLRSRWFDPDRKQPFPESVHVLTNWLQDFDPENATRLPDTSLRAASVCPVWEQPLEPQSASWKY